MQQSKKKLPCWAKCCQSLSTMSFPSLWQSQQFEFCPCRTHYLKGRTLRFKSWQSHIIVLNRSILEAGQTDALCLGIRARTGWPSVNMPWLGKIASFSRSFSVWQHLQLSHGICPWDTVCLLLGIRATTGWPSVNIPWLGKIASFSCSFSVWQHLQLSHGICPWDTVCLLLGHSITRIQTT